MHLRSTTQGDARLVLNKVLTARRAVDFMIDAGLLDQFRHVRAKLHAARTIGTSRKKKGKEKGIEIQSVN